MNWMLARVIMSLLNSISYIDNIEVIIHSYKSLKFLPEEENKEKMNLILDLYHFLNSFHTLYQKGKKTLSLVTSSKIKIVNQLVTSFEMKSIIKVTTKK